jgi:serine/threonine protein kinase
MSAPQPWQPTAVHTAAGCARQPDDEHESPGTLPRGTRLDEFEIVRTLGAGGFGIVYLALDHTLLRYVAIKEYMPTALAGREAAALTVALRAPALAGTFAVGLESFFNEARFLAKFDHPSLVKVHRFWKANGTAYMAMQYYPGKTLKEARLGMEAAPDESWLCGFVEPLLSALEILHVHGVYHRDISPDNILLLPDGRPVLLDFGSARRVIGDRTQSLTALLKPNFAPVEQYADEAGMRQGPWTDLYALGATVHFMLTGKAPTPSVLRAVRDVLPALSAPDAEPVDGVGRRFLAAVDWTLALDPASRPQSVEAVRQALRGDVEPPMPTPRHREVTELAPAEEGASAPEAPEPSPIGRGNAAAAPGRLASSTHRSLTANPSKRRRMALSASLFAGLMALGLLAWNAWAPDTPEPMAAPPVASAALPDAAALSAAASHPGAAATLTTVAPILTPTAVAPVTESVAPAASHTAAASTKTHPKPGQRPVEPSQPPVRVKSDQPVSALIVPVNPPIARASAMITSAALVPPSSPKQRCGDLNFFALALCVSQECRAPGMRSHPQCLESRRAEEARERRMNQ